MPIAKDEQGVGQRRSTDVVTVPKGGKQIKFGWAIGCLGALHRHRRRWLAGKTGGKRGRMKKKCGEVWGNWVGQRLQLLMRTVEGFGSGRGACQRRLSKRNGRRVWALGLGPWGEVEPCAMTARRGRGW